MVGWVLLLVVRGWLVCKVVGLFFVFFCWLVGWYVSWFLLWLFGFFCWLFVVGWFVG